MKFIDDRARIVRAGSDYIELATTLDARKWAQASRLDTKSRIRLEASEWKPPRSVSQNDMFHGLCREIARATGNDAELVKEAMKEAHCPRMRYGDMLVVTPTHILSPGDMSALIEATIVEAIECGADTAYLA